MIESLSSSIEPLNGTGFPDWKSKFEMAVQDIEAGALGAYQNSEMSENEIPWITSDMEHQAASQVYFIQARKSEGEGCGRISCAAFDVIMDGDVGDDLSSKLLRDKKLEVSAAEGQAATTTFLWKM